VLVWPLGNEPPSAVLIVFHHHIIRHQMNGVALNQERTRVVKVLFRLAGADFEAFNQRRRFAQLPLS
jgi:hypothetical protein